MPSDFIVFHYQGQPIRFSRTARRATPEVQPVNPGPDFEDNDDGPHYYWDRPVVRMSRHQGRPVEFLPDE